MRLSHPTNQAGKGSKDRSNPAAYRTGFDAIRWSAKQPSVKKFKKVYGNIGK